MPYFKIEHDAVEDDLLPSFTLNVEGERITSIYSDTDMQDALAQYLYRHGGATILNCQDGLYERLTVEANIKFYHKWFGCQMPLAEILVMFALHTCAKTPLHKCSESEIRRVYFAKYYMSHVDLMVFVEPIHGMDLTTINTFISVTRKLKEEEIPVLILVSNVEHALLLGDMSYKLKPNGIEQVEVEQADAMATKSDSSGPPTTVNLFKIPAKVDDKIILFDPPEIDYIESQNGKGRMVINNESYIMDSTLAEIEKKLKVYGFYRCHRSYIVNLQKVREIITWSKNTYSLRIDNQIQSTIPLSRTKIQDIQEKFSL